MGRNTEVAIERDIVRDLLRGLGLLTIASLATIGLLTVSFFVTQRLAPMEAVYAFFAKGGWAQTLWEEAKLVVQIATYLLGASAIFLAVARIKTVAKMISDYLEAKGPIQTLGLSVDKIRALEPTIQSTAEKLEDVLRQLGDMQRFEASQPESAVPAVAETTIGTPEVQPDDRKNWEQLREYWNANGRRLDAAIDRVEDNRKRSRIRQMPKRDYPAIIDSLAAAGAITNASATASRELHALFMSYKNRARTVRDNVVGAAQVFDAQLEKELNPTVTLFPVT